MACPKCTTRVMVPGSDAPAPTTPFEHKVVERSLQALEQPAGGSFAAASFELPEGTVEGARATALQPGHLIVPRWTIYAVVFLLLAAGAVSFMAGAWWARVEARVATP